MSDPQIVGFLWTPTGVLQAEVKRVDDSKVTCAVIVSKDGTIGVRPPRGEWLHTPPAEPLEGQEVFTDAGEAP